MSADLVAFLRGCLDEDERIAHARRNRVFSALLDHYGMDEGDDDDQGAGSELTALVMDAADWSLERDLAEAKAKRAILDIHAAEAYPGFSRRSRRKHCSGCYGWDGEHGGRIVEYPCPTTLALIQPYAGRPGWSEEWAVRS